MDDPIIISATIQEYAGLRYYLCGFYFQRKGDRLHRRVWADANGPIPRWYHVHHVNEDRADNRLANLFLIDETEHLGEHSRNPTPAQREARAANRIKATEANARLTPEQRSVAAKRGWEGREPFPATCRSCGCEYLTHSPAHSQYCGGTCRARARRARLSGRVG